MEKLVTVESGAVMTTKLDGGGVVVVGSGSSVVSRELELLELLDELVGGGEVVVGGGVVVVDDELDELELDDDEDDEADVLTTEQSVVGVPILVLKTGTRFVE